MGVASVWCCIRVTVAAAVAAVAFPAHSHEHAGVEETYVGSGWTRYALPDGGGVYFTLPPSTSPAIVTDTDLSDPRALDVFARRSKALEKRLIVVHPVPVQSARCSVSSA